MAEEEENNEDENPADFEEEEFPEDIEDDEDFEESEIDDDEDDDGDIDEDDEDDEEASTAAEGSDEEDDDDPADVEADLDAILKDRIASGEDEEEEDGNSQPAEVSTDTSPQGEEESVEARRKGEVTCNSCFLIIEAQIAKETGECPHCGASV